MDFVTVTRRGGAAVLTYANPPIGTMTAAGAQEMLDKLRPLAGDPQVRSIVITGGVPGIFIRHYDVGELSTASDSLADAPAPPPPSGRPERGFLALVDLIAEAPKPVVAPAIKAIEPTRSHKIRKTKPRAASKSARRSPRLRSA